MITQATISDIPQIYAAMKDFAKCAPLPSLSSAEPDSRRCQHLIADLIHNHVALVAKTAEGDFQGMLLAQTQPDIWLPQVKTLRELAWWVLPQYRGTSAGYKLLSKYQQIADTMVKLGYVQQYTITLMSNSPQLDLHTRGWQQIETNYVGGIH